MTTRIRRLDILEGDQLLASDPAGHAALSASAGTGKTHVLTARVLRLLQGGVDPSAILCLTFTKAGAAEMADRIQARLAHWVRLKDGPLANELQALGEDFGPERIAFARTLFARVLDAPGGLRIQTIHAFAQSLLGSFPAEAGLAPGFRPLEERDQARLAREALADLLIDAERTGDLGLVRDMQRLSHRLGEAKAETYLLRAAAAAPALAELGSRESIEPRLRRAFDLPPGDVEQAIAAACTDAAFDIAGLDKLAAANAAWGTKTGLGHAATIADWRGLDANGRAARLGDLAAIVLTQTGDLRAIGAGQTKADPDYGDHAVRLASMCQQLLALRARAALVADFAAALRAGQAFARAYGDAKRAAGAVDFDDLIRVAEQLLLQPGMGDWVRFKLDQRTDHILVDEAQDTNARQWNIVRALTLEYFAGEGGGSDHRTIFTVGDFKQAIFRFQGTDPGQFEIARNWFAREAEAALQEFRTLSIDRSFRTSPPVLEAVDGVIAHLGHHALGLPEAPNRHDSAHPGRQGSVTLWKPYVQGAGDEEDEGEEGWISDRVRAYADRLAAQVREWLDAPFALGGKVKRPLKAQDIMILVRRRSTLAALIVARLHERKVPVAGVDRLLLSAPLGVQDLLAAIRFAVQPLDDLNLAGLLVSPLIGWSQDELYDVAADRGRAPLWPRVRDHGGPAADALRDLLAMADYATPHQFLETILSGPLQGRRKLLARLGREARDPIEELVSSALDFESGGSPSLQEFLDWFARGEVWIARESGRAADAVRVLTVHGAKGLQAPVVILADALLDPARMGGGDATLRLDDALDLPVFRPRKAELAEPLAAQLAAQDRLDLDEHWRLLYVAMTRAEERLYVGGALGSRDKAPPEASWYRAIEVALGGLGAAPREDERWGAAIHYGDDEKKAARDPRVTFASQAPLPDWTAQRAPEEARPPRPLAPSALPDDGAPNPPPGDAMRAAAERGKWLHALFERLPDVPAAERQARAEYWLERSAGIADPAVRTEIAAAAIAIITNPAFAPWFTVDALAEAPIAAVTADGNVIAGTIDRLVVTDEAVRLLDFKTGRRVPGSLGAIPPSHLAQMAAYAAALERIFPDHRIEAALLYTAGPRLFTLDAAMLEAHRPLAPAEG